MNNLINYCNNNGYDYRSLTGQLFFMKYELIYVPQDNGNIYRRLLGDILAEEAINMLILAFAEAFDWKYDMSNTSTNDKQLSVDSLNYTKLKAERGDVDAICDLGWLYENGYGCEQNYYEAFRLYKEAAEKGNVVAMYNLGCMYRDGLGCKQNYIEAKKWLEKSALEGYSKASKALVQIDRQQQSLSLYSNRANNDITTNIVSFIYQIIKAIFILTFVCIFLFIISESDEPFSFLFKILS